MVARCSFYILLSVLYRADVNFYVKNNYKKYEYIIMVENPIPSHKLSVDAMYILSNHFQTGTIAWGMKVVWCSCIIATYTVYMYMETLIISVKKEFSRGIQFLCEWKREIYHINLISLAIFVRSCENQSSLRYCKTVPKL